MTTVAEISVDELAERMEHGAALFDVREVGEYESGHVAGAILIPLSEVPTRLAEFPTSDEVFLICRSGARSGRVCELLTDHGVQAINVAGGTLAWVDSGRDIVQGSQPA